MSSLKYWVWLSTKVEVKPFTKYQLFAAFGDAENIYLADERAISEKLRLTDGERRLLADKNLDSAGKVLAQCDAEDITIMTIADAAYPTRLRNIYDPPLALYIKGRLPTIDEQVAIGIVGTRRATTYGIKMGQKMGFDVTRCGAMVVSGLAEGVDSAGIEGALRAGGPCVGVLGCAIDQVYPRFNGPLFKDVAAAGALVSEYPPGLPSARNSFPERNRIISGLSVGVVIIEAPDRSGALITASRALEQGREVFVVPGNADAPNCIGSNALIREGATLVTNGWDVMSEFLGRFPDKISKPGEKRPLVPIEEEVEPVYEAEQPKDRKKPGLPVETGKGFAKLRVQNDRKNVDKQNKREYIDLRGQLELLSETQLKIVSAITEDPTHIDDIIDKADLPTAVVLSELTVLEIKGFVKQEGGKRFLLNIIIR